MVFKAGDKVVCVDDRSNTFLKKGRIYTVDYADAFVYLEEVTGAYFVWRFRHHHKTSFELVEMA